MELNPNDCEELEIKFNMILFDQKITEIGTGV